MKLDADFYQIGRCQWLEPHKFCPVVVLSWYRCWFPIQDQVADESIVVRNVQNTSTSKAKAVSLPFYVAWQTPRTSQSIARFWKFMHWYPWSGRVVLATFIIWATSNAILSKRFCSFGCMFWFSYITVLHSRALNNSNVWRHDRAQNMEKFKLILQTLLSKKLGFPHSG